MSPLSKRVIYYTLYNRWYILVAKPEGLTTINRVKENINKTVFAYLKKSTWVDIITSIIKGTLAQWLEHHIMILKVVIVRVTGSNPVCVYIKKEGQFATKQNPTPKPLSKWRRILNILFE